MKQVLVAAIAVVTIAISTPSFAQTDNQKKSVQASGQKCCTSYCARLYGSSGRKYAQCLGVGHCNRSC